MSGALQLEHGPDGGDHGGLLGVLVGQREAGLGLGAGGARLLGVRAGAALVVLLPCAEARPAQTAGQLVEVAGTAGVALDAAATHAECHDDAYVGAG